MSTRQAPAIEFGLLAGLIKDEISFTPPSEVVSQVKPLDLDLLDLARVLSR